MQSFFSVDVGSEQTKVCTEDGTLFIFPTAVAEPRTTSKGSGAGQKVYRLENGDFVFGNDALMPDSRRVEIKNEMELIKHLPGLICAAADAAGIDLHKISILSTGLSVWAWRKYKLEVEASLKKISCNGKKFSFDRVNVFPQGVGAVGYHNSLGASPDQSDLLVDVGYHNVHAIHCIECAAQPKSDRQYSGMGTSSITHRLKPFLAGVTQDEISDIVVNQAIRDRKCYSLIIDDEINAEVSSYADRLAANIQYDFERLLSEIDNIVITGGGAHLIGEAMKKRFSNVIVLPLPEYGNVCGYAYVSQHELKYSLQK